MDPDLAEALATLGADAELRSRLVALCKAAERRLPYAGRSVRDEVTGPLVDALHATVDQVDKELASGDVFRCLYRSKIARDLVLSPDERPDHVFEPQTTKLVRHLATGCRHLLVGGAYSGDHAVFLARDVAGDGGTCHAFEPNPAQFAMLQYNARALGVTNIVCNRLGLWEDEDTTLRLVGDDACAHAEVVDAAGGQDDDGFETVTIDGYGARNGVDSLGMILLDIEGSEFAALRGASGYLAQPQGQAPDIVFEVHRSYVDWSNGLEDTDLLRFLTDFGYHVYAVRDFQSNVPMPGCKVELTPLTETYLEGPPHGFNMLASKDPALFEDDLFRICPGVSPKLLLHKDPALHHPTEWLGGPPPFLG